MVNDELSMIMPGTRFEVLGIFLHPTCTRQTSPPLGGLAGTLRYLSCTRQTSSTSVEGLLPFPPLMEEKGVGNRPPPKKPDHDYNRL